MALFCSSQVEREGDGAVSVAVATGSFCGSGRDDMDFWRNGSLENAWVGLYSREDNNDTMMIVVTANGSRKIGSIIR